MNGTGGQPRGTVVLTLDARPENLALTRLALAGVAANAGAPREIVADLKLAVTEACTNAIQHAYADGTGTIVVRYTGEPGMLSVEVEDSGGGFEAAAPPATTEQNGSGIGHGSDDHPGARRRAGDLRHRIGDADPAREAVQPRELTSEAAPSRDPRRYSTAGPGVS